MNAVRHEGADVGEPGDGVGVPGAVTPPDEVDDIVAAWQRERADLDVAPLQVMSRLDRLAGVLGERRAAIFARHDLRKHEFDVLAALRRAGEPFELRAGALALATYVTSGTMTSRLDGLTERGLVTRAADRDDGRLVRVALTPAGRARVDAAFEALLSAERELLAPLPPGSLGPLADSLRALLAQATTSGPYGASR
jgi:DNA-binding MarR family transcriptional regulator